MRKHIKGTGILFPILMRQHRLRLLLWLSGLVLVSCSVAYAYPDLYPDQASREAYSMTMENPAMIAMLGIGYDHYQKIGSLFALEMLLFSAIAVAIMNILLMSKLTRDDEENGILELVQSRSVGRLSYLTASFMVMLSANVLFVILLATAMGFMQIDGFGFSGVVLYSSLLGSFGLLFGTMTAFFAHFRSLQEELVFWGLVRCFSSIFYELSGMWKRRFYLGSVRLAGYQERMFLWTITSFQSVYCW